MPAGNKLIDITGRTFNSWTVIRFDKYVGPRWNQRAYWLCRCECGNIKSVQGGNLRRGMTTNCGCQRSKIGVNRFPHEYSSYSAMLDRCLNPKSKDYPRYGGHGITVCPRWRESFQNFLADMGPKPTPAHQIERRDNALGYSQDNCRWATRLEQARNRSNNRMVTLDGLTMTISQHAERLGISPSNLWHQLDLRAFKGYSPIRKPRKYQ